MNDDISGRSSGGALISVRNITKHYPVTGTSMFAKKEIIHAVDGVSFDIREGETLGLVGESGCGKSTTGRLLVGIEKPDSGSIFYRGQNLLSMDRNEKKRIRIGLQMIFQDPYSSLNPRKHVFDILSEPMLYHHIATKENVASRVEKLLEEVGLPGNVKERYPHEFSGGQRQRIVIAKALSLEPDFIVCDEPVSALDNSIQAQILNLLKDIQNKRRITYLFIAHGLGIVHYVSHRVAVMYLGKIVEIGGSDELFRHPAHPYSQMLLSSAPIADPLLRDRPHYIPKGEVPYAINLPHGCRFHDRCPYATEKCKVEEPELRQVDVNDEHLVACWNPISIENRKS